MRCGPARPRGLRPDWGGQARKGARREGSWGHARNGLSRKVGGGGVEE